MSFECTEKPMSVASIKRSVETGESLFDNVVQRGLVWNAQQKSDLIYSLAVGIRVPEMFARRKTVKDEDGEHVVYDVLDGKQRMNTIYQYLIGAFKLKKVEPVTYIDANKKKKTIDISGMLWNDIPEMLKRIIEERVLRLVVFDDATDDEIVKMFILLNNGKPLSSKNKALAHCKDRENMLRIGRHQIFNSALLKKNGRENKDEVVVITKCWLMLNKPIEEINFRSKALNEVIENIKISKADEKKLNEVFDYADDVLQGLNEKSKRLGNRFVKETQFVSLVPFIRQAIDKKIKYEEFVDFIEKQFSLGDKKQFSEEYTEASSNSTASPQTIQIRHKEIEKAFNKEFK